MNTPDLETDPNLQLVEVEVLTPLSFDGDPETEGAEFYAPKGWTPPKQYDGAGNEVPYLDGNGDAPVIAGDRFTTTRIQAMALVQSRAARIVA